MKIDELQDQDTAVWADHYVEPHTEALYRMDRRGNWYDVEGVRLTVPIFLRGGVLVSLPGKVSRKSYAFADQTLLVSARWKLIQIGRLVLDERLAPVRYFGDRLAGLGATYLDFGAGEVWQEVLISLNRRGFLHESEHRPLVINDEEIIGHVATYHRGGHRYDVLQSATRRYVTRGGTEDVITVDGHPVDVDFDSYVRFRGQEVARTRATRLPGAGRGSTPPSDGRPANTREEPRQYIDLGERIPFRAPSLGDVPIFDLTPLPGPREELFRVRTPDASFVFDAREGDVFGVDGGELLPQDIRLHPTFPNHLLIVTVEGQELVCDRATQTTLAFGDQFARVATLTGKPGDRLMNATGTRGERLVLDTLHGMGHLTVARAGGSEVYEVIGAPFRLGAKVLQRVTLRRMGGPVPRVLVINEDALPPLTLPEDLLAYDDQDQASVFAGCPIVQLAEGGEIEVGEYRFVPGKFLSFIGSEEGVLLNVANGRPLHLDGDGHRNELVTNLLPGALERDDHLGHHRMVRAQTLTEDHKKGEVMFSAADLRSWLPFYDGFLPIFRRAIPFSTDGADTHFVLYELRESGPTSEYIAVEKYPPHRVLVQELDGRYIPNIITNRDRALPNPEEMTALRSFLTRAGKLVEVP